jgi:hypothetical protein
VKGSIQKSHSRDSDRKIEKLNSENQYMEHIIDKVREHFKLDKELNLIDIEIFLNRLNQKKNGVK